MKVVLLCRVSTNSQDYNRQVNELTVYCQQQRWSIERVFANKVSGAKKNEERPEIIEMVEYVKTHEIDRICVLEISRLGRNTLEALKVIELLNEKGICLFVKNYNLETIVDGKINPIASLICTILLEIAQMERLTIRERMASGREQHIAKCRKEKKLTQAQLAERLNITDRAVSKWETGKSMPDSSIMLELCEILGITVNDLLSGEKISMESYEKKSR